MEYQPSLRSLRQEINLIKQSSLSDVKRVCYTRGVQRAELGQNYYGGGVGQKPV